MIVRQFRVNSEEPAPTVASVWFAQSRLASRLDASARTNGIERVSRAERVIGGQRASLHKHKVAEPGREGAMKIPFLSCMSLLTMVACTTQQSSTDPTWTGAGQNAGPAHVGGSAANTTTAFDGTYQGISNSSASAASHLTATGTGAKTVDVTTTPCHQFDAATDTYGQEWPRAVPGARGHLCEDT